MRKQNQGISNCVLAAGRGIFDILSDIVRFNSANDPNSNQCKFSITHNGREGLNGFSTQWITDDRDVNDNREVLNGMGHQVDTAYEKLSGTGKLHGIIFHAFGSPCVKSITIACGNRAVPGTGRIQIQYKHMNAAYIRDHGMSMYNNIKTEWDNDCVHFRQYSRDSGYINMYVNPDIFKCSQNDDQCIQSHLNLN